MSRASTLVKNAALAMMGTSLLVFPVAAQQMAVNTPNFSTCDQLRATDPAQAIQCRVNVLRAQGVAAERRLAQADTLAGCLEFLKTKKASGETFDRPITKENACTVAVNMGMHPN